MNAVGNTCTGGVNSDNGLRINDVLVVGSINTDLVVAVPNLPQAGETVLGDDLQRIGGGQGRQPSCGGNAPRRAHGIHRPRRL